MYKRDQQVKEFSEFRDQAIQYMQNAKKMKKDERLGSVSI